MKRTAKIILQPCWMKKKYATAIRRLDVGTITKASLFNNVLSPLVIKSMHEQVENTIVPLSQSSIYSRAKKF